MVDQANQAYVSFLDGSYYTGDQEHPADIAVPDRPSDLHVWDRDQTAWVYQDIATVRAQRILQIEALAATKRRQVVGMASPAEMASWTAKAQQAALYVATSDPSVAPSLVLEASIRGVSLADLVARVQANAAAFWAAEARIAGRAGNLCDQVRAETDPDAIIALDISQGWGD